MYESNRNRKKKQPQIKGPTAQQMFEAISYRDGVQERMLLRILRYLRLQGSALESLTDIGVENMFDVNRLVAAAKKNTDATNAMKEAMDKALAALREAQDDPDQLEEVLATLEANTAVLATAATSGTPADGGEVPDVVVPGSQGGGNNDT